MMLSRSVYGGSVFNSPATHSQPALAENDTDKYKTKLTLEAVEFYKDQGSWDHVDMQVFGGDLINHRGVINRANSELVITSIKNQPENNNIKLFGGSNLTVANAKTYADSKITYYAKYTDAYNKPIYGGSYLNGENTLHSGDSCLDFVKGWTSIASPNVFGGSYAAQTGATHSGDSSVLIRIDSPTASSVIYGGSHLYAAGTTHSGKSNITVSGGATYVQKNAFGGSLIEGYEAGKKSVHSGESSIVIKDGIATAANFTMFGGSDIKAQNGEHSGKSSIVVENGYESGVQSVRCKGGVYGGSRGFTKIECVGRYEAPGGKFPSPKAPEGWMRGHIGSMYSFLDSVFTGRIPCPSFEDGYKVQVILDAAHRSFSEGKEIYL